MSAPQFDIVFRGVREGVDPSFVKAQFAALFKLDSAKVERIFKAKNVTLKNHADERLANIFVARLLAIGVLADKLLVEQLPSKAIYSQDLGETSTEACAMHQAIAYLYGEHTRRIPFIFSGSGFEYFKLWLVNVLVCVLSAGVLYPWAQVRSLRYFYQHTQLDNAEFLYTSNPQKIFLVQFALVLYVASLGYAFFNAPRFCIAGVVSLIVLLPFYCFKRSAFKQQHSFYCDTGFQQTSTLRDVYRVLLAWPLLAVLSAGLAAPYTVFKIQQYRTQSTSIGGYTFSFSANIKNYLPLLFPLLTAEFVTFTCVYYREYFPLGFSLLMVVGLWLLVFVRWRVALVNLQWNAMTTKLGYFVATWDVPSYNKLVVRNLLLCMVTLGFYWPWAKIRTAEYNADHLAFFANQRFKKWRRRLE
jgi:uncharacterized membrane protein YjgN (DUF898 family)